MMMAMCRGKESGAGLDKGAQFLSFNFTRLLS
jgi:hypothetical protein